MAIVYNRPRLLSSIPSCKSQEAPVLNMASTFKVQLHILLVFLAALASSTGSNPSNKIQIHVPHTIQHHHHTHHKVHIITIAANATTTTSTARPNTIALMPGNNTSTPRALPTDGNVPGSGVQTNIFMPQLPMTFPQGTAIQPANVGFQQGPAFQQPNGGIQPGPFFQQPNGGFQQGPPFQQSNNGFQQGPPFQQSNNVFQQGPPFQQPNGVTQQVPSFQPNSRYQQGEGFQEQPSHWFPVTQPYQHNISGFYSKQDYDYPENNLHRREEKYNKFGSNVQPTMKFKTVINVHETKKIPLMELLNLENLLQKEQPQRIKVKVRPPKNPYTKMRLQGTSWEQLDNLHNSEIPNKDKLSTDAATNHFQIQPENSQSQHWMKVKELLERQIYEDFPDLKINAQLTPFQVPALPVPTLREDIDFPKHLLPGLEPMGYLVINGQTDHNLLPMDDTNIQLVQ